MEFFTHDRQEGKIDPLTLKVVDDFTAPAINETSLGLFEGASQGIFSSIGISRNIMAEANNKALSAERAMILAFLVGLGMSIASAAVFLSLLPTISMPLLVAGLISFVLFLISLGFETIPEAVAKKYILKSTVKLVKGQTLYIVDEGNHIRTAEFVKSDYIYNSNKSSGKFLYTIDYNEHTIHVDSSKVFLDYFEAEQYKAHLDRCMKEKIYFATESRQDAEGILIDPDLANIFLIFACSHPASKTISSEAWPSAARYYAQKYYKSPREYILSIYCKYSLRTKSEPDICPLYREGPSFWEENNTAWNGEKRTISNFLDFYRAFKEEKSVLSRQ